MHIGEDKGHNPSVSAPFFVVVVDVVGSPFCFKSLPRQRLQTRSSLRSGMTGSAPAEVLEEKRVHFCYWCKAKCQKP